MTRPVHLLILFACAGWCAISFLRSSRINLAIPTVVLGLLSVWGLVLLHGNRATSMLNMYTVLAERVVHSDARYTWFVAHGMPDVPGVRESDGYDFAGSLDPALTEIVSLPVGQAPPSLIRAGGIPLAVWVRDHGWRTYTRFVVTHPRDSMSRVSELAGPTLSPHNDDFLPLEPRDAVPRLIFGDWRIWTLIGMAAMMLAILRSRNLAVVKATAAMWVMTASVHVAGVLTSGIEHQRHAVTTAVLVRVLPLVAISAASSSAGLVRKSAGDDDADV